MVVFYPQSIENLYNHSIMSSAQINILLNSLHQVFKVCANHFITSHIKLSPNSGSDRSWVWSAMDASEGTVQNEQLAVRFKTADTAKEFKEAVDRAKQDLEKGGGKEKKTDAPGTYLSPILMKPPNVIKKHTVCFLTADIYPCDIYSVLYFCQTCRVKPQSH